MQTIVLLFAALVGFAMAGNVLMSHTDVVENEWIVVLKRCTDDQHTEFANTLKGKKLAIGDDFQAVHVAGVNQTVVARIARHVLVDYVEANHVMHAFQPACQVQKPPLSWSQDRVTADDANDLDDTMPYKSNAGAGVDAYIIDTGIRCDHIEFTGRCIWGTNTAGGTDTDKNGHGTHVAGTVAGSTYGFAKEATVIAVKVLNDEGSGSNAGVIAGVEWAVQSAAKRGRKSLANMSLGGGKSTAMDQAVNAAVKAGLTVVVAAGNSNADACQSSPAAASDVITVGATDLGVDKGTIQKDVRSYFSNWGNCVDVFAPGSTITAAWPTTSTAVHTISGTSMASPAVAGVAAIYLGDNDSATPADVWNFIKSTAQTGKIDMLCSGRCANSANLLLHKQCD